MKRILFVDDEQDVLNGLRNSTRKYRSEIEFVFARGAEAALSELVKQSADVVVSDMRMPGMDGGELLGRVKEMHPATARIILSGYAEREAVLPALLVAHQILSKPCDTQTLMQTLSHACQLHALLDDDTMRNALGRLDGLPSLPSSYWNLIDALSQSNFSIRAVAGIIETDSAMCTKLLQIANSSCFGAASAITDIERAVSHLGADTLRSLVLSVNVFRAMEKSPPLPEFSPEAVQSHATLTARLLRILFPEQPIDAFTAALVHDIGHVVLACCDAQRFRHVLALRAQSGRNGAEVESEVFGMTHSAAGAYLLGLWGLPLQLVEAVAYHHDPRAAAGGGFGLCSAVSVADALAEEALAGSSEGSISDSLASHLQDAGVLSELPKWRHIVSQEIDTSTGSPCR